MSAFVAVVAIALSAVGLYACGGGSGDVVAQVGETAISKTDLNHWMSTLAGGDFNEVSAKHTVPAGLVSEPANYPACVASLEAAAARALQERPRSAAPPKETKSTLLSKCRQLYLALRWQALNYLISSHWMIGLYGDEGVKASDREIMKLFRQIKAREFPRESELRRYLAGNRRSLADELFVVKMNVLSEKVQQKLTAGGKQALADFTEAARKWTAKTNCRPGYVVRHCRQFVQESRPATPPPSVLMEQVATITGRPCINRQACG